MDNPSIRNSELATEIVEVELRQRGEADEAQAFAEVFAKLRRALVPVVGELGYAAVLNRAVWLAAQNAATQGFPPETTLTVKDLALLLEREGLVCTTRWAAAVIGESLSLLNNFIGEKLTLRIVARAFPERGEEAWNETKPPLGRSSR
jgi:hypothetical protein